MRATVVLPVPGLPTNRMCRHGASSPLSSLSVIVTCATISSTRAFNASLPTSPISASYPDVSCAPPLTSAAVSAALITLLDLPLTALLSCFLYSSSRTTLLTVFSP